MLGLVLLPATPVQAGLHLWTIREIYTDASGGLQFVEFFTTSPGEIFVNGASITLTPTGGGAPRSITLAGNFVGSTANKAFIIGTAAITNFGGPKPDFIIPSNFVSAAGGSISYFGQGGGPYTALPTDGTFSRTWVGGANATNSPRNFADQTGRITIPPVNAPPVVVITSPANNSGFSPLATIPIVVAATDDVAVASVRLETNGVVAATNTVAPFGFTLTNLANGDYVLRALAFDGQSLSATSAPVIIRVTDGPVLVFSRGLNGPIQFQFNSITGASYVVERASPLTNFTPIVTNPGNGGIIQFSETNSSDAQRTYRVRRQ